MATFFGEVLSVYSRAVEEDEDELEENEEDLRIRQELEEKRSVRLQWTLEDKGDKLPCSHLVIAVGTNAAKFLSVYLLSSGTWEPVGHASVWNERTRAGTGRPGDESTCVFYRHKDKTSVLMCQVTCCVAEDQQFQWTEKVFSSLQHRQMSVMLLSDSSLAGFQSADYLRTGSAPFLRCLHTGPFIGQPDSQSLEQPNILTGLPAAVISHCQVHQIAAVVYQCYSDVIGPDSVTMETYKPALTKLCRAIHLDLAPNTDILHSLIRPSDVHNNLYI